MARRGFKPTAPGRAAPLNERRQPLLLCSLEPTRVAMHAINVYIGIGQTAENIAMHISTSRRSCPASRQTPAEPQRVAPYSGHARPTARPISGALTIVAATSSEQSSVSEPLMGRPIGDRTAATITAFRHQGSFRNDGRKMTFPSASAAPGAIVSAQMSSPS